MKLPTQLDRIHIIGGSGSGKTTLAQRLSSHLNTPLYELDLVAYERGVGAEIELERRIASLQQVITQPRWVTEGVYIGWTASLLDAADLIVWLDLPFYVNGWRILYRHVRLNLAGTNRHPSTRKLVRFLWYEMKRQTLRAAHVANVPNDDSATTHASTAHFLRRYEEKLIRCTTPAEVARFKAEFFQQLSQQ